MATATSSRRSKALLALMLALFASACTTPTGKGNTSGTWEEINVNGTRCIVWDGFYAGGIACDFSRTVAR